MFKVSHLHEGLSTNLSNQLHKSRKSQNKVMLSPLKENKKKKYNKVQQKQNNFILDCTNKITSGLKQYNYLKDKYLNYCIVKIPRRKRIIINTQSLKQSQSVRFEKQSNDDFKQFLKLKKQEILSKSHSPQLISHQNINNKEYQDLKLITEQIGLKKLQNQNIKLKDNININQGLNNKSGSNKLESDKNQLQCKKQTQQENNKEKNKSTLQKYDVQQFQQIQNNSIKAPQQQIKSGKDKKIAGKRQQKKD